MGHQIYPKIFFLQSVCTKYLTGNYTFVPVSPKFAEIVYKQDQRSIAGPMRKWRKKLKNPPAQNRQAQLKKKYIKIIIQLGLDLKFSISRS